MAIVSKRSKRDPNLRWFDEARFGMFVHFGLYALLGRGEWVMHDENIPREDYQRLMRRFNPSRFDADAWIDVAEAAGARYITVTAKHHDGFCLFDSAHTDFKITNTPFGRDLIGELIQACQRRGMRIVLYYSQPDWHHPNYVHKQGAFKDLQHPPASDRPDWPKYQQYLEAQVLELVTKYGRIDGIWFDGSHKSEREWRGRHLYRLIKRYQPGAVVNDRARHGDLWTPERSLPEDLTGFLFEACDSVSPTAWCYQEGAPLYSVAHLVESLIRMAGAGGNYLLNVGPRPDGSLPPAWVERMRGIGDWLRRNGEAVYRTDACRLVDSPDLRATHRGNAVYLFLLRWPPTDRLLIPGVRSQPVSVHLLGGKGLAARLTRDGLAIAGLPPEPVETSVNVIRLRFDSPPRLRTLRPPRVPVGTVRLTDGIGRLNAADAQLHGYGVKGSRLRLRTPARGAGCISGWWVPEQYATWRVHSTRRRRYRVGIRLACPAPYQGSLFAIRAGGESLGGEVAATASFDDFRLQRLGVMTLPRGEITLTLRVVQMPYGYVFADVRSVELEPAGPAD